METLNTSLRWGRSHCIQFIRNVLRRPTHAASMACSKALRETNTRSWPLCVAGTSPGCLRWVLHSTLLCHFIITLKVFDPCVATSCQYIPFPPSDLDMVYVPDDQNSLSLLSELSIYNPRLPFSMKFPGADFCGDNGEILMIVGEISKKQSKKPLEIVFPRAGTEVNKISHFGYA